MKQAIVLLLAFITISATAQSVKNRVVHNQDPSKYRKINMVHAGAGEMAFTGLIGSDKLSTNFLYLHAGEIYAKGGIGHHFHHNIEEMYVILDGEAEFTINGHTSVIKGPVAVPCKKGDAHAVYNHTNKPIRWLNFAVSMTKAKADNFDLADNRVGAKLDPIPVFVSGPLKRESLRPATPASYTGNGIQYRRVLGPDVFSTNWNHVDQVAIPAGSSAQRKLEGIEEVYYVMKGSGNFGANGDSTAFTANDVFYGLLGENITLTNTGKEELELVVIGVAANKGMMIQRPASKPKAMVLQMDFVVTKENAEAFEKMYNSIYVPAMTVQKGYLSSKLLRFYPETLAKEIQSEASTYNYQIQISFDTEENRRKWVASPQHQIAWPAATSLAKEYKWRGYDVMGDDDQQR